jgi:hypothetical protein
MPQMRRGNGMGATRAGKAGTKVTKARNFSGLFKPRTQGISAHGTVGRVESQREEKDRIVG